MSWEEGEDLAVRRFEKKGWRIVARNFRTRKGEIDIIAAKDMTLVCAEIKTWGSVEVDEIEYALNGRKRRTYTDLCRYFLYTNEEFRDYMIRFDVVFVDANDGRVIHIEDAFTENG